MTPDQRRCATCEAPLCETTIGYLGHDGHYGTIAGYGCATCRVFWELPGARPVITGRFDFGGVDALTWFVRKLHALGCEPHPRP